MSGLGLPSDEFVVQSSGIINGPAGTAYANTGLGTCSSTGVITISGTWNNQGTYVATATGNINSVTFAVTLVASVTKNGAPLQTNGQLIGSKLAVAQTNPPVVLRSRHDRPAAHYIRYDTLPRCGA